MLEEIYLEKDLAEQYFERNARRLAFSGARNFRDLGGYQTLDGQSVRWELLYRSDSLHKLTDADLRRLSALFLDKIIDFRAEHEKEQEADRLPEDMDIHRIGIPILDSTTEIWRDSRDEFVKQLKAIDPAAYMKKTNVELATRFTPEYRRFMEEVFSANGRPILFHCAAGKDRTGFAAAILLRILGVPPQAIMVDYLLSNEYYLSSYNWNLMFLRAFRGRRFASVMKGFLEVRSEYLSAALDAIDHEYGSFNDYVRDGLGLVEGDIRWIRKVYLS